MLAAAGTAAVQGNEAQSEIKLMIYPGTYAAMRARAKRRF
jgi:hypothetical protein